MKCPNCDGRGTVEEPIYNKSHTLIKNWKTVQCDVCGGKGEFNAFKQTNFDRITQSEESLAEWIADKCNEAVDWILHEMDEHAGNIDQDDYWYRADVLVEWLKQESE